MKIIKSTRFTYVLCSLLGAFAVLGYALTNLGESMVSTLSVQTIHAYEPVQPPTFKSPCAKVSEIFLHALAMVESSGRDDVKPGDGGRALGRYQIHDIYRREANRIVRQDKYTSRDRLDPEKAGQMVATVLEYWSEHHTRRGIPIGPAELCSLHRHPTGHWSSDMMLTPLERGRTARLMQYLE
jgi:hypothetical protein